VIPRSRFPNSDPLSVSSLSAILAWHCRRYPLLRARDIYKLVHQGVFGPGHLDASGSDVRASLTSELQALATQVKRQRARARSQGPDEQMIEEIDPGRRLVRVNLRPMLEQGAGMKDERGRADVEWLVQAMVESVRRVKGDPELMRRRLSAAVRWCRENRPRQAADLERLSARAEASGYPAFHHSEAYTRAYRPAYRVVLRNYVRPVKKQASGRS
jgi:hypothetical protein